ncbi:metallophosphoesterase family protein [Pseudooceanicola algae]|uniref:3',5'-cyclic adenosine monophosphate phosphodiesterase CpdA n=1 Tax=Pseudooceanicola algae TaxID=1537215 RepID=A0A418SIA3_9RHOB|nr:metallophosphoesterase [Pseudooceanicola algae]QPM88977.1 3',5'-cyclic adenosine monophosphate phosphodiesterase CpdA [Pseudooceanicola algae]
MTRILHLSDLHYGRTDPDLEDPLLDRIAALSPDLVVVSGDLTQRARHGQFSRARAFLDRITAPVLTVPGNHDTPLDNLFMRFFKPFSRYRKHITRDLEPRFHGKGTSVFGINSVNPYAWQTGRLKGGTLRRLGRAIEQGENGHKSGINIAVLHHPLETPPERGRPQMRGAAGALRDLAGAGTDVVLSGHLHNAHWAPFTSAPGLLFVQAGTGLSTRLRGEENTFNMLDCAPGRVEITAWAAGSPETPHSFEIRDQATFLREDLGWKRQTLG